MNQIIRLKEETPSTPLCQFCGGPTRLIGSERSPGKDNTDLLTYICSPCDKFAVMPVERPPSS